MYEVTKSQLEILRRIYPKGTRLQLVFMDDPHGVPEGTIGEVDYIDDAGQIHMKWSTGSTLALIPGKDVFWKV